MQQERIWSISENTRGLPCLFKPIVCEEGYCPECQIYLDWLKLGQIAVVCVWCGKEIYRKPGLRQSGISHGICLECQQKHFPKTERLKTAKDMVTNSDETENKDF